VDATQLAFYGGKMGETPADLGTLFSATLSDDGKTLVVQPRDPVPPGVNQVVLVIGEGAISGAHALPACGAGSKPDKAYAEAKGSLPSGTDAALALPFRVATTADDLLCHDRVAKTPVLKVAKVEARTLACLPRAAQRRPAISQRQLRAASRLGLRRRSG
jgi:hypothetical protein